MGAGMVEILEMENGWATGKTAALLNLGVGAGGRNTHCGFRIDGSKCSATVFIDIVFVYLTVFKLFLNIQMVSLRCSRNKSLGIAWHMKRQYWC
ncbi:MAG: hypothetical protein ABH852_02910 [Methanobacteriota archaeon]